MSEYDLSKPYIKYCEDVINGNIVACKNIILACKRFKSWFSREDLWFDYVTVDKYIRFTSKMKHSTGQFHNKPFILMPWQTFLYAGIFGWKWKENNLRVTKNVLAFMARKNAKSSTMAAISLILSTIDGEHNSEIAFLANSSQQARTAFSMTQRYAKSIDPNGKLYVRYRDSMKVPITESTLNVFAADASNLDSYNFHAFILDEFHSQKNWDLYNVCKSSQGMRRQALSIIITTAGFLLDGYPLFEMRKNVIEILEGKKQDDTQFALLYELDENDDYTDEKNWIKSNPSLDETVSRQYLREQITACKNQPSLEVGVLTKNFNMFCSSSDVWIQSKYIDRCMGEGEYTDFAGDIAYGGVDLASVSDMSAFATMYAPNPIRKLYPDKFVFFVEAFLPDATLETSVNKHLYAYWAKHGYLHLQKDSNVQDYDYIQNEIEAINKVTPYYGIYCDRWNSSQFCASCQNAGLPIEWYSQSLASMNRPVKALERLVLQNKVVFIKNDCLRWCFNNCVPRYDHNENVTIDKNTPEQKIDCCVACVDALGGYLENSNYDVSIY